MQGLGSNEGRRADDDTHRPHRSQGAEVDQLCLTVARASDIAGAEVAVNEAP